MEQRSKDYEEIEYAVLELEQRCYNKSLDPVRNEKDCDEAKALLTKKVEKFMQTESRLLQQNSKIIDAEGEVYQKYKENQPALFKDFEKKLKKYAHIDVAEYPDFETAFENDTRKTRFVLKNGKDSLKEFYISNMNDKMTWLCYWFTVNGHEERMKAVDAGYRGKMAPEKKVEPKKPHLRSRH